VSVDITGVGLVTIALLLSFYATKISFDLFKDLNTHFFQYGTYAYASLSIMISGYYFPAVFSSIDYQQSVTTAQLILASFGILALAFMVHAIEYVKRSPNESIINTAFILAGGVAASRFIPGQYLVQWTGSGWQQHYGISVIGLSTLLFIFLCVVLGPVILNVIRRIREADSYKREGSLLLLGFVALLLVYGVYMIISISLGIQILPSSINYYLFMLLIAGFTVMIARLLLLYPTLFFSASYDIFELQLVSKTTNDVVYRYLFHSDDIVQDLMGIPIAQTSIKQVFNEALEKPGNVKSIRVKDIEVLVAEGERLYGMLLTHRGSTLYYRLLVKSVELYESEFSNNGDQNISEFSNIIGIYFQFAIHRKQTKMEVFEAGN